MSYDARGAEFEEQLKTNLLLGDRERDLLSRAFKDYLVKRNACFDALLKVAGDDGTSEHSGSWTRALDDAQAAVKTLGEALNNLSPPSTASDVLLKSTTTAESRFFTALAEAKLGERQDALLKYHREMRALTESLAKKWDQLLREDENFDRELKDVSARIEKLYDEAAAELVSGKTKAKQLVANLLSGKAADPLIDLFFARHPELGEAFKQYVEWEANVWLALKSRFENEVAAIKRSALNERGVVVTLFKQFRRDTRQFLDANPLEKAVGHYDGARRSLEGALANTITSGQKSDSQQLVDGLLKRFDDYVRWARDDFDAFVYAHREKFFGPVGADTKQALLEGNFWREEGSLLARKDLSAQLRAWHSELDREFLLIDYSKFSAADTDLLKRTLDSDMRRVFDATQLVERILDDQLRNLWSRENEERELSND